MNPHDHLPIVDAAQRSAEKIAHANLDRHLHAVDGTAQDDAFAVKLDLPHATVCAGILRIEADGQRERVEPQCTARPRGIDPACCCLTPHRLVSPPGVSSPSLRETLPELPAKGL